MFQTSQAKHPKERDLNCKSFLPFRSLNRDLSEYPDTLLGELAYRFRELYWRYEDHPRPAVRHLAQTAHLVGLLSRECERVPLSRRTEEELQLLNYLVTPRVLWPDAQAYYRATAHIVGESFVRDRKILSSVLRRAWTGGDASPATYHLHQIAIHLCADEDYYREVAKVIRSATPASAKYSVSSALAGGAFSLLSVSSVLGDRQATSVLLRSGLDRLGQAEGVDRLFVVDPMSRPTEYRFTSLFFADLLRASFEVTARKTATTISYTDEQLLDITRSWLEGSHHPVHNYFAHSNALSSGGLLSTFLKNYSTNGIRNFKRLELSECEDPWFLMNDLAERPPLATAGGDVILVAIGSGDHNDAFRNRGWEFEGIRSSGEEQGWSFDLVEVRDSVELSYHILRHHQQGSRVAVLHHLGHGSHLGAEYGQIEREKRSEISLSSLFTDRDHRELCSIAKDAVDSWVLHHCSTAARVPGSTRRLSNLAEALYKATDRRVTITGLRGNDAFDELTHSRDSDNRVRFTGRPVWKSASVLQAAR